MFGISLNNRRPIHEQLTDKITELVLNGVLEPESPLPSVREMAADLGVNPNTIQRAYAELERTGVTYSVTGKGRFVTDNVEAVRKEKQKERLKLLHSELLEIKRLGISEERATEEVRKVYGKGAEA